MVGLLSLLTIVTGIFSEGVINDQLIGRDPAHVLANIVAHSGQVRLAYVIYMVEMACGVAQAALFYLVIRPVSRSLAFVALCLNLTANILKTGARLFFLAPFLVVAPAPLATVLDPSTAGTLTFLFLRLNDRAAGMGLVFFGFADIVTGYLLLRATFLPRVFGVISIIGGLGWLTYLYQPLAQSLSAYVIPVGVLGAVAITLWLLIVGVDEQRWREQAQRSGY